MRVLSILIVIFITMITTSFAQTIQSEFIPSQKMTQLKVGDLLEATIRVWPIENADLAQFKKLEKTIFFNALYLTQITGLGVSQNNADVVELKALFIIKSANAQSSFNFKYNDSFIELQSGALAINDLKDESQDFYILDQSLNKSMIWKVVLGFFTLFFVLVIFKHNTIKGFLIGLKLGSIKKSIKKYDDIFRKAAKREDYESLYEDRDLWMELLTEKAPAHYEFLKTLNQYQFKKDWSNSDYEEVKSSFDVIRRSFEK